MPKIFISYGRDNSHGQRLATEAQQQLQGAGFEVFRDLIGLKPGDVWYSKLEFGLECSDAVVLIVSEKIRKSQWVHNEISMANEIGLPVIPVIAETIRMPLWLRHLQVLDFSQQANWGELFSAIHAHLEQPGQQNNTTQVTPATKPAEPVMPEPAIESWVPSWAENSGKDQYGQFADLRIKNVTQRFRLIQPGTFLMGSPESELERRHNETQHQVTLSQAFWLADTACTQAMWLAVMGNNPARFKANENNPVEQVSWEDTQAFIQTLSRLKPGLFFQLPTEAQWEYACRAGATTPFFFGENITADQVNYDGNYPYANGDKGLYRKATVPVASLPANGWGLYEMHGNVWEWCQDAYQSGLGSQACTNPVSESGAYRVLRGGSWFNFGRYCRSAYRVSLDPSDRDGSVGFRLVVVN